MEEGSSNSSIEAMTPPIGRMWRCCWEPYLAFLKEEARGRSPCRNDSSGLSELGNDFLAVEAQAPRSLDNTVTAFDE